MSTVIRIMLCLLMLSMVDAVAQKSKEEEALLQIYGDEEMISIATGSRVLSPRFPQLPQ